MIDCLAIGDSIAVGLSGPMHCTPMAQVGRTSASQSLKIKVVNAKTVIISLGSNDRPNKVLAAYLRNVRKHIKAHQVVWIIPYNAQRAAIVETVARERGDRFVELSHFKTRDNIHPSSYDAVARKIMK